MFSLYNQGNYFYNFNRYIWRKLQVRVWDVLFRVLDIVLYILLLITKYEYKR